MKLTRLILRNVRCYKKLDMSFIETDESGEDFIRSRTVILGNNGTGKSTILRSIALILAGSSAMGELIGNPDNWIRNKCDFCEIIAHLRTEDKGERIIKINIERGDSLSKIISRNKESLSKLDDAVEYAERNYLNIGYGVHRRVGSIGMKVKTSNYQNFRSNNVASLFDADASLYPFESWIMDLDYREDRTTFEHVKRSINKLIPGVKFYKIDKEAHCVKFKNKDGVVDFSQLSDGFQITANWVGDLLHRITHTYKDYRNPMNAKFILLIDEIALHLHPSWQRIILESISSLFKNAQIIATTHAPFVAQQCGCGELFTVIRNKRNNLDLYHYENDPRKLLIHQVVMSDIFGLATDESVAVERAKSKMRKAADFMKKSMMKSRGMESKPKSGELEKLKGVDDMSDIPMNLYSHESMKYGDLMKKLKDEIKKLKNDKS